MELKELYIAPEVEIVCFKPVERLAAFDLTLGGDTTNNDVNGSITTEDDYNSDNGDM